MSAGTDKTRTHDERHDDSLRAASDVPFFSGFGLIGSVYIVLIVAMLVALVAHTTPEHLLSAMSTREVRYSIRLSLLSCTVTTILALWVAVPIGYLMSRHRFPGRAFIDGVLDIPIVLPPLVIGLCLLILFNSPFAEHIEDGLHRVEIFLANNIVPLACLLALVVVSLVVYFASRRLFDSRLARVLAPVCASLVLYPILTHRYLFPSLPEWVPIPAVFEPLEVTYQDQSPLWQSRRVYSAKYTYFGTVGEVLGSLKEHLSDAEFENLQIAEKVDAKGVPNGNHQLFATFRGDVDPHWPAGGEIEFQLAPEKPVDRLEKLQTLLNKSEDDLDRVQRDLQKEFEKLPTVAGIRAGLDVTREKLDVIGKDWRTETVRTELDAIEDILGNMPQRASTVQSELETRQKDRHIEALRRDRVAMQQKMAAVDRQYVALRDVWRTEPVKWSIQCAVLRPREQSRSDLTPPLTFPVTYEIPAVILAQFMVACAFAVRTMRVAFDQIHPRYERVALTLGCSRGQAFWLVVFPQSRRGLLAAGTLAWARSLGEFGPILIFAGATRMKTEVLPTTVFLEMSVGAIEGAAAVSLIMVAAALFVLVLARLFGLKRMAI